ncbi:hypothetical protein STEG23_004852, partial [Scotinomys teguina]
LEQPKLATIEPSLLCRHPDFQASLVVPPLRDVSRSCGLRPPDTSVSSQPG